MENLVFVIWMVAYPVGTSIGSYFASKERKLNNEDPFTPKVKSTAALLNIIIWVSIGLILFK